MTLSSPRRAALAAVACVFAAACSTAQLGERRTGTYDIPDPATAPAPEEVSKPVPEKPTPAPAEPSDGRPSAGELAGSTADRAKGLSAFRAQARLAYEGPDEKFKSSQMIVVKAPNQVRIDIMGPFGPSYTVASDGTRLTAYDRGEKVLYSGYANVGNVARYTRVALDLTILTSLLRGLPPTADLRLARVLKHDDGWVLQVPLADGRRMSVLYDFQTRDPLYVRVNEADGSRTFEAYFSEFHEVDGVRTPHEVEVVLANGGRAKMIYEKIWRGVAISDSAFRIDPAKGVRYVDMDEAG